ncbi:MAG TPA: substrate-binding domain-containing protein [Streptosporangiaceae bacterium]|nr:substrate-binding domain-containing protein [Streptosporangiaceae bacterium]
MSPADVHAIAASARLSSAIAAHARAAGAFGAARIGDLIGHSWPVQTAGGALITVLVGWAVTLFLNRKRIAWRAYLDAPISLAPAQVKSMGTRLTYKIYVEDVHPEQENAANGKGTARSEVEVPWLVLLRIRNSGFVPIRGKDFNTPLTFMFPGREVRGAEVIERSGDSAAKILPQPMDGYHRPRRPTLSQRLRSWWPAGASGGTSGGAGVTAAARGADGAAGRAGGGAATRLTPARRGGAPGRRAVDHIQLSDEFLLNRKDRFTLMVVLSGTPADGKRKIEQEGSLIGGRIVTEPPRRGPGTRSLIFGGFTTLPLAGLLAGLFLAPSAAQNAAACAGGRLSVTGSTAFAPVARQIATAYHDGCPAADITIDANSNGSIIGLTTLIEDGKQGRAAGEVAMSDGPAPTGGEYGRLAGTPVGVIVFTLVVNKQVGIYNLNSAQVRDIFDGAVTNWRQLGGPNLPVRIVSRVFGSGTRRAFDAYVLGGNEPSPSSYDCLTKYTQSPVILCDVESTGALLHEVAGDPGAIGYAETGDVQNYQGGGARQVALDGLSATFGNIGRGEHSYPFWTVEYYYTYGKPTGLAAAFLGYLSSSAAKDSLRANGYMPCQDGGQGYSQSFCAGARSR